MKTGFHSGKWANDYYSFGMQMPGRQYNSNSYRYGMMGYEKDDEISGNGNAYDFEGYGYDPRLGRRKGIDPKFKKYPHQSPYVFGGDNPIYFIDIDGLDVIPSDEATKTQFGARLDKVFSGELKQLRENFTYGALGNRTDNKDIVSGFTFSPSSGVKSVAQLKLAIQKSGATEAEKQTALAYFNAVTDIDAVVIDNLNQKPDKSVQGLVVPDKTYAEEVELSKQSRDPNLTPEQREDAKTKLTNDSEFGYTPADTKNTKVIDKTTPVNAKVLGTYHVKEAGDNTLDEVVNDYAEKSNFDVTNTSAPKPKPKK